MVKHKQRIGEIMKLKTTYVLLCFICVFGLSLGNVKASTFTRTYAIHWDNGSGVVFDWEITAPVYASPSASFNLIWSFQMQAGTLSISALKMEVTSDLYTGGKQQIYNNALLKGSYSAGYSVTYTPIVTVPSDAMIGSTLNVSIYTDQNKWFLYPTEVRNMSYDDLQSAYDSAQSQITTLDLQVNSLNQQVASLTTDKNNLNQQVSTLSQQVTTLNSQIADLNSQVSNLKSQNTLQTLTIPLAMVAITIVAVLVAIYMFYSKRKIIYSARQS
jgi:chaperonin cofactor prefoldin